MMRVLIIGGYGTFGLRLAKLLAGEAGLQIILAGRNLDKAKAASKDMQSCQPLKLDRNQDLAAQIDTLPDIIVDCSGPFQAYGEAAYTVPDYAVSIGAHYFDIADGANFVAAITALDGKAKAAGVSVISGLSTYPCLTAAAAAHLSTDMTRVDSVQAGIAPSSHIVMGKSVIGAILCYAGKPVGRGDYGPSDGIWEVIAPPGATPLRPLLFSAVDAPDRKVLPQIYGEALAVRNGAGPQPVMLHRLLMGLSKLVKIGVLPNLTAFHGLIYRAQDMIKTGENRGGMFVSVHGADKDGQPISRKWSLIAQGDDGPNIPVLPVAILIKAILAGRPPRTGAYHAAGAVTLSQYQTEFDALGFAQGTHEMTHARSDLYPQTLGPAYAALPQPIQDLHRIGQGARFEGKAKITRGRNPLSHLLAMIFRLPKAGNDVPVTVTLTRDGNKETWSRNFDGKIMSSTQEAGRGKLAHLVIERFGPIAIHLACEVKDGRLYVITRGWSILGLPLPLSLVPHGLVYEHDDNDRFNFHVELKAPFVGLMVKYEGWLMPKADI